MPFVCIRHTCASWLINQLSFLVISVWLSNHVFGKIRELRPLSFPSKVEVYAYSFWCSASTLLWLWVVDCFKCKVLCVPFLEELWKWALAIPGWLEGTFSVTLLSGRGARLPALSGYVAFVSSLIYSLQVWQPRSLWAEQYAAGPTVWALWGTAAGQSWPSVRPSASSHHVLMCCGDWIAFGTDV